MIGLSREGKTLYDEDEIIHQSISEILKTQTGSRVMRRDFGSNLSNMLDHPINSILLPIVGASAIAIQKHEPRVRLLKITPYVSNNGISLYIELLKPSGGVLKINIGDFK